MATDIIPITGVFDDTTGKLFGLQTPGGQVTQLSTLLNSGGAPSPYPGGFQRRPLTHPLLPFGTSAIDSVFSTGATANLSVDTVNTFNGRNSTKVSVTAGGSSAVLEIGVNAATISLDSEAQQLVARVPMAIVKISGTANTLVSATLYVGDAGYTNFYTFGLVVGSTKDGWTLLSKETPGATTTTNSPNLASQVQAKLRLTFASNIATGTVVNVGGAYVLPKPAPTVVFMVDDGYTEWTWLAAEAKKRGVPISMGIAAGYINTPGFLTDKEMMDIQNDPSGLFEMTNHALYNDAYSTIGLTKYMEAIKTCREYLISKGVSRKSASCHQYVQGSYDQSLIDAMKAEGFICGREVGASNRRALNENIALVGSKCDDLYRLPATVNLENTQNLTTVKTYIQSAADLGTAVIMGHRFDTTAGSIKWIKGYDSSYGVLDLLDWLALMRDTQGWRLMKLSDWVTEMTAEGYRGGALLN